MDVPSPLDSEPPATPRLSFDPEWLAITRAFHAQLSTAYSQPRLPNPKIAAEMVKRELDWVQTHIMTTVEGEPTTADSKSGLELPSTAAAAAPGSRLKDIDECQVFWPTAPGPGSEGAHKFRQRAYLV